MIYRPKRIVNYPRPAVFTYMERSKARRQAAVRAARGLNTRRRRIGTGARGAMKSVALSLAESKNMTATYFSTSALAGGWNHNVLHEVSLIDNVANTGLIPQRGTAPEQRNGDQLFSTGIRVRGELQLAHDRKNTKVVFYLVEYNTVQGVVTNYATFFKNQTGSSAVDPINDNFKVKKLGTFRYTAKDTITNEDATLYYNFWIPFKRSLHFNGNSNVYRGMKEHLSIIAVPYDTYTTLTTDTVVTRINQAHTLYFKDP